MNDFGYWWQHLPLHISPVIFEIGGFKLHWYGLMYLVGFSLTVWLALYRIRKENRFSVSPDQAFDACLFMILGAMVGGRTGYVLFYDPAYYWTHPVEIFLPVSFEEGFAFTGISGMSYHGGLIGAVIAAWIYFRKIKLDWRDGVDLFVPAFPLGYAFGRIGNFINGELYGRITTLPLGMYFPEAPGQALRHPSQLYEAFFEGIVLFVFLWAIREKKFPKGAMFSFYLIGYGTVRFCIEFFRQPDAHLGPVFLSFTMGQVLCGLMILIGVGIYGYLRKDPPQKP